VLLSEAFERYRQDVIIFANQSRRTEESHNTCLKVLLAHVGDIDIETITFEVVRDWKLELNSGRSPGTVRQYILKLRVVLAHMQRLGYQVLDYELIPVPKRADHVPGFISKEDVTKLIDSSRRLRSKTIISLLYASGLRVSELCILDRAQIHDRSFTVIGKGNKARLCFFDARTEELIKLYLTTRHDNHPALFLSTQQETRMTPTNIQFIIKAAANNAGLKQHITPHTLRHSYATNLLHNNVNLRYVQEMLGHSSIQTTQMYTHVVNEDLRKVYSAGHTI